MGEIFGRCPSAVEASRSGKFFLGQDRVRPLVGSGADGRELRVGDALAFEVGEEFGVFPSSKRCG